MRARIFAFATFSIILWMPSWGGMINGLLTLRGAWHKVAEDPVLKFFVVGITFYGIAYVMVMSSGGTLARFASNRARTDAPTLTGAFFVMRTGHPSRDASPVSCGAVPPGARARRRCLSEADDSP